MTTCNADESVARGCALQCAMLSPSFRVREFVVNDVSSFPITGTRHSGGRVFRVGGRVFEKRPCGCMVFFSVVPGPAR